MKLLLILFIERAKAGVDLGDLITKSVEFIRLTLLHIKYMTMQMKTKQSE